MESLEKFKSFPQEKRDSFKLLMGHLADHFLPFITQEYQKIIFVRDPVDHFISGYHYLRRATHNKSHKIVSRMKSIEEYIAFRRDHNFDNIQSRHISGMTHFLLKKKKPSSIDHTLLYDKTKAVIQNTDFLFIMERFDESILILKRELEWASNPYYKTRNKTKNRPRSEEYSDAIRKEIKSFNAVDMEMYNLCKDRFELMYKNFESLEFRKTLLKFRRINGIRSLLRI